MSHEELAAGLQEVAAAAARVAQLPGAAAPLLELAETSRRPWCVVVAGRVGVGKTTLVNRLTGAQGAVGLGGVTAAPGAQRWGAARLIDTPGVDDPDQALGLLGPLFDDADAVVWVVDGLQPLTASEREVMALGLSEGTELQVVVSRTDLLTSEDVGDVLRRVRGLLCDYDLVQVVGHDVRRLPPEALRAASAYGVGRRRLARVRLAMDTLYGRLHGVSQPRTIEEMSTLWKESVRAVVGETLREITDTNLSNKHDALRALSQAAGDLVLDVSVSWPPMPKPRVPKRSRLGLVLDGFAGAEGARRVVRAEGARWMVAGEVMLQDWWGQQGGLRGELEAYHRLEASLAALEALITPPLR